MSKTSNPKGVGAIKTLWRQPGTSFNSTEISSGTGSSLPAFLQPCSSPPRGSHSSSHGHPSVCPWKALRPPGHSLAPSLPTSAETHSPRGFSGPDTALIYSFPTGLEHCPRSTAMPEPLCPKTAAPGPLKPVLSETLGSCLLSPAVTQHRACELNSLCEGRRRRLRFALSFPVGDTPIFREAGGGRRPLLFLTLLSDDLSSSFSAPPPLRPHAPPLLLAPCPLSPPP